MKLTVLEPALLAMILIHGIAHAGLEDPLPALPIGPLQARLTLVAGGFDVEEEFVTPVFTQRVGPTDFVSVPRDPAAAPGQRWHIVTNYGGRAQLLDDSGTMAPVPFLDLGNPQSVNFNPHFEFGGAHGLTTLAFHPSFHDSSSAGYRKFYVVESEKSGTGEADFSASILAGDHHQEALYEYTLTDNILNGCNAACTASKRELLRVTQPGWHHNLGDLIFGADGLLYIGSGDGSVATTVAPIISDNAQMLDNVFGKILRIDPLGTNSRNGKYGIPADNPFVDQPQHAIPEIYAYGLRNPYRLDVDAANGDLYASETGELMVESINRIVIGGNHGWNRKEGSFLYDRFSKQVDLDVDTDGDGHGDTAQSNGWIDPLFEYDRSDGLAVIGGAVSRTDAYPELFGKYVFGDFRGGLFYGDPKTGEEFVFPVSRFSDPAPFNIHSINRDDAGQIYVLGIRQLTNDQLEGVVMKLERPFVSDGDFDGSGVLDVQDIDLLSAAVRSQTDLSTFDIDGNRRVDQVDREHWVHRMKKTYFGDTNLDGRFRSDDLLIVMQSGEYEDTIELNSTWATGDWTGDGEFESSDLVTALADGGYERGAAATRSVPEPVQNGWVPLTGLWLSVGMRKCRKLRHRTSASG